MNILNNYLKELNIIRLFIVSFSGCSVAKCLIFFKYFAILSIKYSLKRKYAKGELLSI